VLVQEVLSRLGERFDVTTEDVTTAVEQVVFKLPRALVTD
jgi:4-hydroxy-3-methylbut-2-enyl diphosphate reductase